MNAPLTALTAFFVAIQLQAFGVPNPRGPVPPVQPQPRPPVKLTPPKTTPPQKSAPPPSVRTTTHAAPIPPRLPTQVETETAPASPPGEIPPLPPTIVKRYRPAPDQVTLPQLFELLKSRSPRYQAAQAEIDVAESEAKAARVLPNPILNFAILYLNSGFNQNGVGTYYANLTFPVLIAGQRRMRMKAANAGVEVAKGTLENEFETLAVEARNLFVELQADQARLTLLDNVLAELEQLQTLVEARRGAGVQSKYDQVWATIDRSSWRTRRAELASETDDTAGRLAVLAGDPMWQPEAVGEFRPLGLAPDFERTWPDALRARPDIDLARRQEAFANRNIDMAKREAWPVPSITAGTVVIQNYFSASTSVGITVPIPMFDWGQGLLARARAASKRAQLDKDATVAEARAELARAVRRLGNQRAILDDYERDVSSQFTELRRMSEDAFRSGQVEFRDLADAIKARVELELTHVDLIESVMLAEVAVLAASGRIEATEGF
ncbi:TolC family protein [Nannocystis punicea]|uniref:TolC family protein n=1 Tax=Nannocystis punicea TaxID=2995304 RepID=A0ABY7H8B2_9BACT|nr:TolC family protein [Nannocystis poenicansa]WAS95497.1 TolC family protein [Nannocystis poenicansa]